MFVYFVSVRLMEPQRQYCVVNFLSHVLAVGGHATMLSWLHLKGTRWGYKDLAPEKINSLLFDSLQMRIKPIPPCIHGIYVHVMQVLKSEIQSKTGCYANIQNEHQLTVKPILWRLLYTIWWSYQLIV